MAKKRKLKFGSPAWRKKYLSKAKRKNASKRKKSGNTYTRAGARAKRKRLKEMIRSNPPRKWTKVKAVRVVRKRGRDVLEIRK